jgi:PAS domain S-box-containing protein
MTLQRDHYKVFFDTSREGMYATTKEGYFLDANLAFCQLLGYQRIELLRLPVEDILALPMERRRFRHEIDANGAVSGFRIKLLTKAGDELPSQINAVVLRDFQGEVDGYIGMVRPLRAAPEIQQFGLALRGSQDGLWEWDLRRNEVDYSSRWKALLGYASFELSRGVGEWLDRVHPEDSVAVCQAIQTYVKGDGPAFSAYFRMKNKAGDYLWMLARAVGDFDENGKCLRLAGSLSNITAHIKMVEALKVQEEQLEHINQSLVHDKALLTRYFSGDVLSRILSGGGAQTKEALGDAAILQVRINRVEGLWQQVGTAVYAGFLNDLLTDLMDLAYGKGGSVNKILGDTLLISFGAPLAQDDDLTRAVVLAREFLDYRKTFNAGRPDWLAADLEFSMGLAWGEVFSGTLGSVHRIEYTLVGAPVSRADLLQHAAERARVPLLVDRAVKEACGTAFDFRTAAGFRDLWTLDLAEPEGA